MERRCADESRSSLAATSVAVGLMSSSSSSKDGDQRFILELAREERMTAQAHAQTELAKLEQLRINREQNISSSLWYYLSYPFWKARKSIKRSMDDDKQSTDSSRLLLDMSEPVHTSPSRNQGPDIRNKRQRLSDKDEEEDPLFKSIGESLFYLFF